VTEPDVALTDFALAAECAVFALWPRTSGRDALQRWLRVLFAASAAAPLAGGLVHGFYSSPDSALGRWLWVLGLFCVGVAGLACWALAAHLSLGARRARTAVGFAAAGLSVYAVLLVLGFRSFAGAVAMYLPAVLALLAVSLARFPLAAAGLGVTLVAAVLQQRLVSWPALGLSHNALYHVIQALGFALFFAGSRRWQTGDEDDHA
jgi:uncharacterized protein DUF6962